MSAHLQLTARRTLVTGGSRGIGQAVVAILREAGAKVLTTAQSRVGNSGDEMLVVADLRTAEGCARVADAIRERFGGVDIIDVVGGSSAPAGGFTVLYDEEWEKELNLDLLPAVRLDRALLPAMIEQGSGVIKCRNH